MDLTLILNAAKFLIWLTLNIRDLVLSAEKELSLPNQGGKKFAAVKEAVIIGAQVAGVAQTTIDAIINRSIIDTKINDAVATEINAVKVIGGK